MRVRATAAMASMKSASVAAATAMASVTRNTPPIGAYPASGLRQSPGSAA